MFKDHEVDLTDVLKEVRRIDVQARRLVTGVMAGSYNSVFRGTGVEFDEVREYVEGDDPRSVDWNVTARVGKPYIKRYVEERSLTVLFLVDLSASMTGGFGYWSARQMAARVVACLGVSAVANHDQVGLVAFSQSVDKYVRPDKGVPHVLSIVRDCLALPASSEHTEMKPALRFAGRAVRRHAVVFLISDFLGSGWEKPLSLCARRHDVTAIRLINPELEPPEAGIMRVRDPETGRATVIDWNSPRVRAAYRERVSNWHRRTERALRSARVDLMDVPVPRVRDPDAVARPILRFFRMREQRRAKQ